ncbi:putative nuclear pore complex protein (NUP155) [Trypanosoma rangeli]|uniref:Putative nuclear pore complex protein (NUP155) n=1 Tax=Trypanosoma rangeli TaxID=5698 RepID=A0A422NVW7_TRYRA|nr:putative nuclear pore complex protein (NUP155) [Trypanosoma rangeli]RNF09602.1 putative nuclear pore complex protein (NUP155) [Trypanosoma rangeli]|eukprot:RNF09602.1 putative nuclear pore complex protein (NUP155) [Trypanosoma rangeli]
MEPQGNMVIKIEDAVKKAVEDTINAEVRSGAVGRYSNPSASGHATSHPLALTTFDTSSTLPDFIPLVGVAWPEPVKAVWKTFKANSIVGLFPELSRAWITVDNKLLVWNYGTGRDFLVYDEIPELIVAVGNPVTPATAVFQPHITLVFPVATPKTIHLLGLCVVGDEPAKSAELCVVNLGFSALAPTLVIKFVGLNDVGRIFTAGADGCLYELMYTKESTQLFPRVRLINYSIMFAGIPILSTVSSLMSTFKQAWGKERPALLDVALEAKRKLLFTLDAESTIAMWRITDDGLKFLSTIKYTRSSLDRYRHSESSMDGAERLVKIFCVSPYEENCSVVVIASNGEQHRYICQEGMWDRIEGNLTLRDRLPSYVPSNREVSVCFASDGIAIFCHTEKDDESAPSDSVTVATSPKAVIPPHHHCRDIVAHFEPSSSRMVRVDAIGEVPVKKSVSPNELCSQVSCSSKQFVFAHRHGISTFMKLRPVDTLHMILSFSGHQTRDSLLQRFSSVYNASDYCCMLVQIAVGCTNVPAIVNGPYIENGIANSPLLQTEKSHGKSQGPLSMEKVGSQLINTTSQEAQRLAREILRNAMMPSWHEGPTSASGGRQIVVQVSPFALGVAAYIGRALYKVWEMTMGNLPLQDLAVIEVALSSLVRLLNSLKKDVWSENLVQPSVPFRWDQSKVTLTFPPYGSSVSSYDLKMLQSAFLYSAHFLCERVLQTIKFAKQTGYIPLSLDDSKVSFAQVVCDQSVAHRLARYIGRLVLSSEHTVGFSQPDRIGPLTQLQLECPYFFSSIDVQEYSARIELDQILSSSNESLHACSESKMTEWESSVSRVAASLWTSGALQGICQQLKALKKEDAVVRLLLHAASQLDPSNSVFEIYLAERNGNRSQNFSSTLNAVYQQKVKLLTAVVGTLEETWNTHRSVVDDLLGGPLSSGSIWQVEPSDEMAHCFLFDWMCVPRDDATITSMLKETLSTIQSPFLEAYLQRNALTLGEQYAHYLRRTKKNFKKAIEVCAAMAQAPLADISREERIPYRLRCWSEARDCAAECNSDQLALLEERVKLMEAQLQLSKIICEFINSGLPQLDRQVSVSGQALLTERQIALEQLELVDNFALSISQLLEVAGLFCAFGGAEVQLDVLSASNVTDASLYAACIEQAFQRRNTTVEETARRIIGKCRHLIAFPLSHVAKMLEAHAFHQSPEGSTLTVDILTDCGVEHNIVFFTLASIVEKKDAVGLPCEVFDRSGVTDAFLVHSLAVALHHAVFAPHLRSVQLHFLRNALNTVREGINRCAYFRGDECSRRALTSAEQILEQCHLAAGRLTSRPGF